MRSFLQSLLFVMLLNLNPGLVQDSNATTAINWQSWSTTLFELARSENKPILLSLDAASDQWSIAMHQQIYTDKDIAQYINDHYLAVRINLDERADLNKLFQEYGRPATVVFNASGDEIARQAGFVGSRAMKQLLESIESYNNRSRRLTVMAPVNSLKE